MRTIHVELETPMAGGMFGQAVSVVRISTEVIVGDDDDTHDAGRDASRALSEFIDGFAEATAEDAA